jgi:C1A family cysteine protease
MGLNQFSALSDTEFAAIYLRSFSSQQSQSEGIIVE